MPKPSSPLSMLLAASIAAVALLAASLLTLEGAQAATADCCHVLPR